MKTAAKIFIFLNLTCLLFNISTLRFKDTSFYCYAFVYLFVFVTTML